MHLLPPEDPRLYAVALPVYHIPGQVLSVLKELRDVMAETPNAIALSAPQVGVGLRFFITDGRILPIVVVNPEIVSRSDELQPVKEGCLTWPGRFKDVSRPYWIVARFLNVKGDAKEQRFSGLAAAVFQHELDHLDGICIFPRPDAPT